MKVINVRGTHGAGKSTLVRKVMAQYRCTPVHVETGRRIPIGYKCRRGSHRLFVLGSYEFPFSGGCDNIQKVKQMFDTARKYLDKGYDILMEGILAQHSTPNFVRLAKKHEVHVIWIDLSERRAIRAVKKRRRRVGNHDPFNPFNLQNEIKACRSSVAKLQRESDAIVHRTTTRSRARRILFTLCDIS